MEPARSPQAYSRALQAPPSPYALLHVLYTLFHAWGSGLYAARFNPLPFIPCLSPSLRVYFICSDCLFYPYYTCLFDSLSAHNFIHSPRPFSHYARPFRSRRSPNSPTAPLPSIVGGSCGTGVNLFLKSNIARHHRADPPFRPQIMAAITPYPPTYPCATK